MVRTIIVLGPCTNLRNLSLSFSDPEICRDLMELADKCEAREKAFRPTLEAERNP